MILLTPVNWYHASSSMKLMIDRRDTAVQKEVRNVARAVTMAVADLRAGRLSMPDAKLARPRPK